MITNLRIELFQALEQRQRNIINEGEADGGIINTTSCTLSLPSLLPPLQLPVSRARTGQISPGLAVSVSGKNSPSEDCNS